MGLRQGSSNGPDNRRRDQNRTTTNRSDNFRGNIRQFRHSTRNAPKPRPRGHHTSLEKTPGGRDQRAGKTRSEDDRSGRRHLSSTRTPDGSEYAHGEDGRPEYPTTIIRIWTGHVHLRPITPRRPPTISTAVRYRIGRTAY